MPARGWTVRFFRVVSAAGGSVPAADVGSLGLYSDIGTGIEVDAAARTITGVDLDLDVIRIGDRLWLDDEDEFAEHRVTLGYPDERRACRARRAGRAVARALDTAPFDGRAQRWLATFAASRGL